MDSAIGKRGGSVRYYGSKKMIARDRVADSVFFIFWVLGILGINGCKCDFVGLSNCGTFWRADLQP